MNAVLGSHAQDAWLTRAEAGGLLADSPRAAAWDALSDDEQDAALLAVTADVQSLVWRGRPIFADQPWVLPTDEVCLYRRLVAEAGSTAQLVKCEYLRRVPDMLDLVGGAVHLLPAATDLDYRASAGIEDYDRAEGMLTLGEGLNESPAGKRLMVLAPLPLAIRRAIAIQAVERGRGGQRHELADAVHRGVVNIGQGVTTRDRAGRMLWHVDAYWLLAPYLARSLTTARA